MKSSTHYFHMTTKILADFQSCISVPLIILFPVPACGGYLFFYWKLLLLLIPFSDFTAFLDGAVRGYAVLLFFHESCFCLLLFRLAMTYIRPSTCALSILLDVENICYMYGQNYLSFLWPDFQTNLSLVVDLFFILLQV